jgi:hypothetical protein
MVPVVSAAPTRPTLSVPVGVAEDAGELRLAGTLRKSVWAVASARLPDSRVVVAAGDAEANVAWWDAATGELLDKSGIVDPGVVRSMQAVRLPDDRVRFAAVGNRGTLQLWDGAGGDPTEVIRSENGLVWSMVALTLPGSSGPTAVLFTVGDDGLVRRWNAETGKSIGQPFGGQGAVRAMAVGPPVDDRPTLLTGGDDGTVDRWDAETGERIGSPMQGPPAIWVLTVAHRPSGRSIVASCSTSGVLCRWDEAGVPLGAPVAVDGGALTGLVAITLTDGRSALVCSAADGRLSCWDAETGARVGRPKRFSERGIDSLTTVIDADGRVRLVLGDSADGSVTITPVPWDPTKEPRLYAPAQVDSTRVPDTLGRRVLAAHLGGVLNELVEADERKSAVVHVDGHWGSGKSTLVQLLKSDEAGIRDADGNLPVVVDYEAWRECAIAPEWWSLSAAIAKGVSGSRAWLVGCFMLVWSPVLRTFRSPATLIALLITAVGLAVMLVAPQAVVQAVGGAVAMAAVLVTVAKTVGRALFWHSAPFGRLHVQTQDNPLGQVADMIAWLRRWTPPVRSRGTDRGRPRRRSILLVIDDLDRCSAERVVKILETVHTILRHPPVRRRGRQPARLFVLVLADGGWVRQAFASRFSEFQNLRSATRDLGSNFTLKVFDHVVLVPELSAAQVAGYLDRVVAEPADEAEPTTPHAAAARPAAAGGEDLGRTRGERGRVRPASPAANRDDQEIQRVHEATTAVATARRGEHLLLRHGNLMPTNPRMIKRVANALGMLEAIQTHVGHDEDDDTMARAAILLVEFPVAAARLRDDDPLNPADPFWRRPGLREVLGECAHEALARCLGRP